MHLITFHVTSYVLMTAMSAICAIGYRCIFKLNCRFHVTRIFFARTMIMMGTYFNIMADTAGHGGRTVSPLSGLNRTNDNILLYNHSCMGVLMLYKGISKT